MVSGAPRQVNALTVKRVVASPVGEVVFESLADDKPVVRGDPDVPFVEETVKVASQQETVGNFVSPTVGVWSDVGRLERRKRMLCGHGARARVRLGDRDAKNALAETWLD